MEFLDHKASSPLLAVAQLFSKVVVLLYPFIDSTWTFLWPFASNPLQHLVMLDIFPVFFTAILALHHPPLPQSYRECHFPRFSHANQVASCLSSFTRLILVFLDLFYQFLLDHPLPSSQSLVASLIFSLFSRTYALLLIPERFLFQWSYKQEFRYCSSSIFNQKLFHSVLFAFILVSVVRTQPCIIAQSNSI